MSTVLQALLVAVIVLWAALSAFGRLAPRVRRRWLAAAAEHLDRPGRLVPLRGLGRRLRRERAQGGSCGDGCGSCGSCGATMPAAPDSARPLVFERRPSSRERNGS